MLMRRFCSLQTAAVASKRATNGLSSLMKERMSILNKYNFSSASETTTTPTANNGNNSSANNSNGNTTAEGTKPTESPSTSSEEFKKLLAEKDNRIRELNDLYRLCLADQENLRNRTKKEVENAGHFGIQKFAKDLLTVADTMELALETFPEAEKNDPKNKVLIDMYKGLELTLTELISVFKRHGLEPIDPMHHKFDPNIHMALFEAHVEDAEPGKVISVQKKGYLLNNRLIRPASVGVAKAKEDK